MVWGVMTASLQQRLVPDLYGHLIDRNLWDAADRFGGTTGASSEEGQDDQGGALVGTRV
jgi:hypothetical protein